MTTVFDQLQKEDAVPPLYYSIKVYIDFLERNEVLISELQNGFLSEKVKESAREFLEINKNKKNVDTMWLEYLTSTLKGE